MAELNDLAGSPILHCDMSRASTDRYSVLAASVSGAVCMLDLSNEGGCSAIRAVREDVY